MRPLVSQTIIAANVEALQRYEAVDTAIPSADTVIQVTPGQRQLADVLPRHLLRRSDATVLPPVDDQGRVREGCAGSRLHCDR